MWGATKDITTILQDNLGGDTIFQGRFFFCCVAGQEMLVLIDNRRRLGRTKYVAYSSVFVPTLCGRCARRTAARRVGEEVRLATSGKREEPTQDVEVELHPSLLEGWEAFKAVQMYCKDEVSSYKHVIDRRTIQQEVQKFYVRMNTATLEFGESREGMCLKVLPYSDPGFF